MKRVPPSVQLKEEINSLLQGTAPTPTPEEPPMAGFVGRLARYMLQVAIEAEATAFLGREHYRRGERQRMHGLPQWLRTETGAERGGTAGTGRAPTARHRGTVSAEHGGPSADPHGGSRELGAGHVFPGAV